MTFKLTKPVAFIIFNRPDTTARVFEEIRRARPPKLFVLADGPRPGNLQDIENCRKARAVIDTVDWPCEVITNYSESNVGCKPKVVAGLDWIFEQVEEAIILEDDCLPHPTFFRYCSELLDRYRDEERVMLISGANFQFGRKRTDDSYYFSHLVHIWGWASWRRAWALYDPDIVRWPQVRDTDFLLKRLGDQRFVDHWRTLWDLVHSGDPTIWDYQLGLLSLLNDMLTITPERNLISNIGFGAQATHTKENYNSIAELPVFPMEFPMKHPEKIKQHTEADQFYLNHLWKVDNPGIVPRIRGKLKLMFGQQSRNA